jgi:hypothetical protein
MVRQFARLALLMMASMPLVVACTGNPATASVDPTADLRAIRSMHVVKSADDRRHVDALIADELRRRGYAVTTGDAADPKADALLNYQATWAWDITMFLAELTIVIRDPESDFPLASGNAIHGSYSRTSPAQMVAKVVDGILKQGH